MSISGLVVHARPERIAQVRGEVARMKGTEIHAVTDDGRLVVTVDNPDNREASDTLVALNNMDGVLSAALTYNYFEEDGGDVPADKEEAQ